MSPDGSCQDAEMCAWCHTRQDIEYLQVLITDVPRCSFPRLKTGKSLLGSCSTSANKHFFPERVSINLKKRKKKKKRRRDHILMSCQAYSLHIPIRLTDKWSWPVCQADLNQCPLPAPSPQPCSVPPLHYLWEITIFLGSLWSCTRVCGSTQKQWLGIGTEHHSIRCFAPCWVSWAPHTFPPKSHGRMAPWGLSVVFTELGDGLSSLKWTENQKEKHIYKRFIREVSG